MKSNDEIYMKFAHELADSIEDEIKLAILKKAAVMEKIGLEKYMKELKKRQGSAKSSKRALPGTGDKD